MSEERDDSGCGWHRGGPWGHHGRRGFGWHGAGIDVLEMSIEDEIKFLEERKKFLEKHLENVNRRLELLRR